MIALWTLPVLLEMLAFDGETIGVPAAFVGGLVFDVCFRFVRRVASRRSAIPMSFSTPSR